jgi:phosphatidylinositol alpha-mannosyltransferase
MAAGTVTVASNIPAFVSLLGEGKYGALFATENATDLAAQLIKLLKEPETRQEIANAGRAHAEIFDWDNVAAQIFSVYEMAMVGGRRVRLASDSRPWNKFLSREEE